MNQKKYKSILTISSLAFISLITFIACNKIMAQSNASYNIENFKKVVEIEGIPPSKFPQVIEIEGNIETLLLSNDTDRLNVPVYTFSKDVKTLGYDVFLYPLNKSTFTNLSDNRAETYEDLLPTTADNPHRFKISFSSSAKSVPKVIGFDIKYAPYSQKPDGYSVSVEKSSEGEEEYFIINMSDYLEDSIRFPKTEKFTFNLSLYSKQPMRITDITPVFETPFDGGVIQQKYLRFLAQPDKKYSLYYDIDSYANSYSLNSSMENLQNPVGNTVVTVVVDFFKAIDNPYFANSDKDSDGALDMLDNCPKVPNADQIDANKNGVGDACDDFDQDGIFNSVDNCPQQPNPYQEDEDGDKIGDKCDGEESRVSEKYPWLPWLGIVVGFAVTGGVLAISIRQNKTTGAETTPNQENQQKF